jgi:L-Ala-D/L-Glu epimerase
MSAPVRLAAVEVVPYALPFRDPYVTARGRLVRREMVLLRIRDEDGLEGLGEAVPLSLRGGVSIATVVRELEALGEELVEADRVPPSIAAALAGEAEVERVAPVVDLSLPARCAITTAWLDLSEKREGTAAVTHAPVRCNATLVTGPPAAVAAEALRWAKAGFGTFKLKVGAGDDVNQVEAVRAALGPEAKIRLDANASWSLEQATEILAAVEPLGIELVEQPVATIAEAAALAWRTRIPLAGDESIVTLADAEESLREGAFPITGIKLSAASRRDGRSRAGCAPTSPAPLTARSGSRSRGASPSGSTRPASPANGWLTASPPGASSARRSPPPSAASRATCCTRRQVPASAS